MFLVRIDGNIENVKWKTVLFVAMWAYGISWTVYSMMYSPWSVDTSLDNRLLGLRTHIAFLEVIALYVAWRVTP